MSNSNARFELRCPTSVARMQRFNEVSHSSDVRGTANVSQAITTNLVRQLIDSRVPRNVESTTAEELRTLRQQLETLITILIASNAHYEVRFAQVQDAITARVGEVTGTV
jgi:ribosomal protein L17